MVIISRTCNQRPVRLADKPALAGTVATKSIIPPPPASNKEGFLFSEVNNKEGFSFGVFGSSLRHRLPLFLSPFCVRCPVSFPGLFCCRDPAPAPGLPAWCHLWLRRSGGMLGDCKFGGRVLRGNWQGFGLRVAVAVESGSEARAFCRRGHGMPPRARAQGKHAAPPPSLTS